MTPAEKAGWKVGDVGVVVYDFDDFDDGFPVGTPVHMTMDDGTQCPRFQSLDGTADDEGDTWRYLYLVEVSKWKHGTRVLVDDVVYNVIKETPCFYKYWNGERLVSIRKDKANVLPVDTHIVYLKDGTQTTEGKVYELLGNTDRGVYFICDDGSQMTRSHRNVGKNWRWAMPWEVVE